MDRSSPQSDMLTSPVVFSPRDLLAILSAHRRLLLFVPAMAGVICYVILLFVPPVFTARTVLLPPQQQQSLSTQLGALGAVGGLGGLGALSLRTPADQYVSFLGSTTVLDRLIDRFGLLALYDEKYREEARRELVKRSNVSVGKKDGLITIEVDDRDPKRSADMANAFVDELRSLTSGLAVSEAQMRRVFFESKLTETRDRLADAQRKLEGSGLSAGALKAEVGAATETYARLQAETTAAEVRLSTLRNSLSNSAPEVMQAQARLSALRAQLQRQSRTDTEAASGDYIGRLREFKYQEALFELYARQYELARADEGREGALIQVVDPASPPERKSKPKRVLLSVGAVAASAVLLVLVLALRGFWHALARAEEAARPTPSALSD